MSSDRFDRQLLLFGPEGQAKLRAAHVAVVGVGGLGTHVVQQLALLGVGKLTLIDDQELDHTNRNRYVGVWHTDPIPGSMKVELGERLVELIDPSICVTSVGKSLMSRDAVEAIKRSDHVIGSLDNEGARLVLTELCSAYSIPYIDLASDVSPEPPLEYGGRVLVSRNGTGCLVCMGRLDLAEAGRDLENPNERRDRAAIYGVDMQVLGQSGPSVVSINGVVASLGVTEFMVMVTGLRAPQRLLTYYGRTGKVTASTDQPQADCYYCKAVYGRREATALERYLEERPVV